MLPPGLCTLFLIVKSIKDGAGSGPVVVIIWGLLYFYTVPAFSIYCAAKELFWGQDKERRLTGMKALKMCEHLG